MLHNSSRVVTFRSLLMFFIFLISLILGTIINVLLIFMLSVNIFSIDLRVKSVLFINGYNIVNFFKNTWSTIIHENEKATPITRRDDIEQLHAYLLKIKVFTER